MKGLIADAMLGSLARKLRILGLDTLYCKDSEDNRLIAEAKRTGRALVTADRRLAELARRRGITCFLVPGRADAEAVASLASQLRQSGVRESQLEPRCAICNGQLEVTAKELVAREVPRPSLERHRLFFRCTRCRRVYWHGRHWKKLRTVEKRFRAGLKQEGA